MEFFMDSNKITTADCVCAMFVYHCEVNQKQILHLVRTNERLEWEKCASYYSCARSLAARFIQCQWHHIKIIATIVRSTDFLFVHFFSHPSPIVRTQCNRRQRLFYALTINRYDARNNLFSSGNHFFVRFVPLFAQANSNQEMFFKCFAHARCAWVMRFKSKTTFLRWIWPTLMRLFYTHAHAHVVCHFWPKKKRP